MWVLFTLDINECENLSQSNIYPCHHAICKTITRERLYNQSMLVNLDRNRYKARSKPSLKQQFKFTFSTICKNELGKYLNSTCVCQPAVFFYCRFQGIYYCRIALVMLFLEQIAFNLIENLETWFSEYLTLYCD